MARCIGSFVAAAVFFVASQGASHADMAAGRAIVREVCQQCHGLDGKLDDQMPPLGKLSNDNPWEVLHKVRFGQPNEEMPALISFGSQVAVDLLAYLQSLPQE